jgi:hypothetical protein
MAGGSALETSFRRSQEVKLGIRHLLPSSVRLIRYWTNAPPNWFGMRCTMLRWAVKPCSQIVPARPRSPSPRCRSTPRSGDESTEFMPSPASLITLRRSESGPHRLPNRVGTHGRCWPKAALAAPNQKSSVTSASDKRLPLTTASRCSLGHSLLGTDEARARCALRHSGGPDGGVRRSRWRSISPNSCVT